MTSKFSKWILVSFFVSSYGEEEERSLFQEDD